MSRESRFAKIMFWALSSGTLASMLLLAPLVQSRRRRRGERDTSNVSR
ncbi:hypothetical protein CCYA_CCYA10G2767 [Cyanidiococcus yangmingshanensis]|nr:hypothetical protein CCYA_CCYA10G2767 [Cyanidiococcus yangmingshanensis]